MPKTLLIFTVSNNADAYINPIAHCYFNRDVRKVVFIKVKEVPGIFERTVRVVMDNVWSQLKRLSEESGNYREMFENIDREEASINYQTLRQDIAKLTEKEGRKSVLIDITSCPKRLAADVLTSCLATGIEEVYMFQLMTQFDPRRKDKFLYHNLARNDYEYAKLPSSGPLISGLRIFSMKENKRYYSVIATAFLLSLLFGFAYYMVGQQHPIFVALAILSQVFGIVTALADYRLRTQ